MPRQVLIDPDGRPVLIRTIFAAKKGTSLSRCLLLAEMVGILPRAKQQPAGLITCGLRAAALFSSAPSLPQKRHVTPQFAGKNQPLFAK